MMEPLTDSSWMLNSRCSGALETTHQVKRTFHVAANVGQVGKGYTPIVDGARCIVNVLSAANDLPQDVEKHKLQSILIPLMGTRPRRGIVQHTLVKPLLDAAIDHMKREVNCVFRKVYFLNYTDKDFEICRSLLHADPRLTPLRQSPSAAEEPGIPLTELPARQPSQSSGEDKPVRKKSPRNRREPDNR